MTTHSLPLLSMLDLVAVREGGTVAQALQVAVQTAQHAEALGFKRYFGAQGGANWIDLAASTMPTTLEFSRWQSSSEIAEPDG